MREAVEPIIVGPNFETEKKTVYICDHCEVKITKANTNSVKLNLPKGGKR